MQIPYKNGLERCMEMTFNDLKEKHLKLRQMQWQLREKLQDNACQLLREYRTSLALPSDEWKGTQGNAHAYVEIGVWKNPGEFEPVTFPRLQMDANYRLNFVISTTIDDSPITGGYCQGISISLWYEENSLFATVGSGDDTVRLRVSSKDGGFFEVCGAIKALISTAIDRSIPNVVAI